MSKKKIPAKPRSGPDLSVGTPVKILRPHLWSSCVGEVVSVDADGEHLVKIKAKPDCGTGFFHTHARREFLEVDL